MEDSASVRTQPSAPTETAAGHGEPQGKAREVADQAAATGSPVITQTPP